MSTRVSSKPSIARDRGDVRRSVSCAAEIAKTRQEQRLTTPRIYREAQFTVSVSDGVAVCVVPPEVPVTVTV